MPGKQLAGQGNGSQSTRHVEHSLMIVVFVK
jgi:hypothetical protein